MLFQTAFGVAVRQLRKEHRFTQKHLAELTDLSIDYIHDIEYGKYSPSLSVIESLAKAFQLKPHEIVVRAEEIHAQSDTLT